MKRKLIDTHTHLFTDAFDLDRAEMIIRASEICEALILPNIDEESVDAMCMLADQYPTLCFPCMGLHPGSVPEDPEPVLQRMELKLQSRKWYGIGETGLDLYWDKSTLIQQEFSLRRHCVWARNMNLPIILHTREATRECIDLIRSEQDGKLKGVFHCFSGTEEDAREIMDLGFYLGIGGVLTYKTSTLPLILEKIGYERIVMETDSPYLPPVPYRGKRNESAYLNLVAEKCAAIWNLEMSDMVEISTKNARELFQLPE